ncbi:MAG TPA: alpha/beta fold hydrolase [Chitinophagaceae bacterium]|jgi:pimeloyl-ACP methyl ester carboxylesterase|nr:alpha/beta fold hydrolase [Chitinophagaceae bacterium]
MLDVYFISGLGADQRLFQYLDIQGIRPHFVHWITPGKNESWDSYAQRLLDQIKTPDPVLIGMSMGGMMAMEVSKLIPTKKVILLSSAKTYHEIPPYFRLLRIFRGHQWFSYELLTRLGLIFGGWLFGTTCKADEALLKEIIHDTDETFFRWAWQRVASWRSTFQGNHVTHLHGNHDHMLPIRYTRPDYVIEGGTHLMVVNKADEISQLLQELLAGIPGGQV